MEHPGVPCAREVSRARWRQAGCPASRMGSDSSSPGLQLCSAWCWYLELSLDSANIYNYRDVCSIPEISLIDSCKGINFVVASWRKTWKRAPAILPRDSRLRLFVSKLPRERFRLGRESFAVVSPRKRGVEVVRHGGRGGQ
jgi:hypothetical protein